MDLKEILSQFETGKKEFVYLSITPGVGLELIQIDNVSRSVKNYAYRALDYNESLKQITDMSEFKTAVTELFEELNVKPKSNVILNLPLTFLGSKELSILLGDEALTTALTAEVEQSYLFKRYEPVVSWVDSTRIDSGEMRKLFYSAVQKDVIDDISSVLAEVGATLVSVKVSITSLLKALEYTGLAVDEINQNISWNLMVVNSNGYSIFSMMGKDLIDYYEEPLAVKSFEGDEIYNAISASAQITLMSYPANSLFVLSETDLVSAEILSKGLQVDCPVKVWDNNDFKKENPIQVSLEVLEEASHKISLEAIGLACDAVTNLNFEFMGAGIDGLIDDPNQPIHVEIGPFSFDISPNNARNIALAVAAVLVIPVLAMFIYVPKLVAQKQTELADLEAKLQQTQEEIKKLDAYRNGESDFSPNTEIKKVLGANRAKLMAYTAIGDSIPSKVWLTYFNAKEDGKFDIKGESKNVEDIYTFYKNMKDSLINTQLRLHKLELKSNSPDAAISTDLGLSGEYEFELTNMSATDLSGKPKEEKDSNNDNPPAEQPRPEGE